MLSDRLMLRRRLTGIIDSEPTVEPDTSGELRRANDELFSELQRLKRYSIKSAVHAKDGVAWSIHDMSDTYDQMVASNTADGSPVHNEKWPPRMVMVAVEREIDASEEEVHITRTYLDTAEGLRPNYDQFGRHVWMDEQGGLFADMHGAISLRDLYEAAGKPGNYESLRQFLLQKYFDLTVPVEIVREVDAQTREVTGGRDADRDRQQGTVYRNLLLPRIRILRRVKDAAELEAMDAREERPAGGTRRTKQHDVVAHPVKLPAGYKPSPEALERAAALGIVLQPGETVRKKHQRGDPELGQVVHRATERKDGSAGTA